jgi:uncharacterized protein YceH (UPF0502 family)
MLAKQLAALNLITIDHSGRTERYAHCANTALGVDRPTLALLTVMLLRGPQSVAQLRSSSKRFHDFSGNREVEQVLAANDLFTIAPRQAGQRGHRYTHTIETRLTPSLQADHQIRTAAMRPGVNPAGTGLGSTPSSQPYPNGRVLNTTQ